MNPNGIPIAQIFPIVLMILFLIEGTPSDWNADANPCNKWSDNKMKDKQYNTTLQRG